MSPRLDAPIAVAAWLAGFAWMARTGSWAPLALAQVAVAARLVGGDPETRRLFAVRPAAIAIGAAVAVVTTAATYTLVPAIGHIVPRFPVALRHLYGILHAHGYARLPLAIVILVVVAAEEAVWRGRLLGADGPRRARPAVWTVAQALLFSMVYALAHVTSGSALLMAVAFALGSVWALLRLATGSIWAPLVAHALWDLAVLVLWPVVS